MMVTRRPGRASSHLGGFFESCLVLCWAFANDQRSVARIKPQYAENLGLQIIGRPKQGPALVEGFPMPQLESASTAAIRATRLEVILPRPARARDGRRRMFQQRRPHLGGNIAARMWLRSCKPSKPTHRGAQQQSLASIPLYCPPRQPSRHSRGSARTRRMEAEA